MTIFVCVDDKNGMMFNKRRQSSDRVIRTKMFEMTGGKPIFMNSYSKKQFVEEDITTNVAENFLELAGEGDFCFVEDACLMPYYDKIKRVVLFKWNKVYPSDRKFDLNVSEMKLVNTLDFEGYSHDKITMEVWAK